MDPILGQIIQVPWTWGMYGWMVCRGQLLNINQYTPLYALIGTTYGGDGRTTFAIPDLRPVDEQLVITGRLADGTVVFTYTDTSTGVPAISGAVLKDGTVTIHTEVKKTKREWREGELVSQISVQGMFPSRQ